MEAIENETERVRDMKIQWLMAGGFSLSNAEKVADSTVDYHFAYDAILHGRKKGYDEDYIVDLLL